MWRHLQRLLAAGPSGVKPAVAAILAEAKQEARSGAAATSCDALKSSDAPNLSLAATVAAAAASVGPDALHALKPKGCAAAPAGELVQLAAGIFALGSTGLALGSTAAACSWLASQDAAPVPLAVLNVGLAPLQPPGWLAEACQSSSLYDSMHDADSADAVGSSASAAAAANAGGTSDGVQSSTASAGPGPSSSATSRYLWSPIECAKRQRWALGARMGELLAFLARHQRCSRTVLICDDDGLDACVCVAVATLVHSASCDAAYGGGIAVSKEYVRQQLATVSAHYPAARPTRGMLKQVFNYFMSNSAEL